MKNNDNTIIEEPKSEDNKVSPKKKKSKVKKFLPLIIIGGILFASGLTYTNIFIANACCRQDLIKYIDTFDKVSYDDQLVPTKDTETGYYTFKTDRDLKILQLTDIHIGGGHSSSLQDKKTIYEVNTILQKEKPDLVVLDGDNTFCVPGLIFRGGDTFNNYETAKVVIHLFEHAGVYFTTVFGNHDTEAFDYTSRVDLGKLYQSDDYKYCIFESNFQDTAENGQTSVTNQCIVLKNNDDSIRKAIMLIDSNAYNDNSLAATINWDYDVIHEPQVQWAKQTLTTLGKNQASTVKSIFFFHIPNGEYQVAYKELEANGFNDTTNTKYIEGVWDEEVNTDYDTRIWYGGCTNLKTSPQDKDNLFEEIGPDGINSMEACFVGHDHVNSAVVTYKGVMLAYGYSIDNLAYNGIMYSGRQRGATAITISKDGNWTQEHRNVYTYYGAKLDKFVDVYMDKYFIPEGFVPNK